jgi:hypothetical protein
VFSLASAAQYIALFSEAVEAKEEKLGERVAVEPDEKRP